MAPVKVGTAFLPIHGDFSALNKGIATQLAPGRWGKLGRAAGGALAGGLVAAGLGKQLFSIGAQFDDATDRIRVGTGATGKDLKRLQADFKAVVKDVPTDFGSASKAVADINTRLGLTGKPLRRVSKQMLELSRITGEDLNENIPAITRLFGDWSVKTDKQSKTLDKLFRTSQATGIGVGELSRLMVQFGSPLRQLGLDFDTAAAMFARFEKEGVNIETLLPGLRFALKTFSKEGREPAKALRETFEAIKNTSNAAEANQIAFETFGVRAGPDMAAAILEGRFELDELIRTMRSGSDTITGAARDTEDFAEKWQRFKNNVLVKLEPIATRVFDRVGKEAGEMFEIIEDPKLTAGEKFDKLADRASEAFNKVAPKLAEAAANAAPRAAAAFARAWVQSDVWGKLIIGGLLLRKMGGLAAFQALGTRAGTTMGTGISAGAASAVAGGAAAGAGGAGGAAAGGLLASIRAKLMPAARGAGIVGLGVAVGDGLLSGINQRLALGSKDLFRRLEVEHGPEVLGVGIEDIFGKTDQTRNAQMVLGVMRSIRDEQAQISAKKAEEVREAIKFLGLTRQQEAALNRLLAVGVGNQLQDQFRKLSREGGQSMLRLRNQVDSNLAFIKRTLGGESREGREAVQENFERAKNAIFKNLKAGRIDTQQAMREIARQFKVHTDASKRSAMTNFEAVEKTISRTMRRGGKVTEEGLDTISELYRVALKQYGLSDAVISRAVNIKRQAARGNTPQSGLQRGGFPSGMVVPGAGSGDNVHLQAMVEPGERVFVLNRNASKKLGQLEALNRAVPRFQTGGMVRVPGDPPGPFGDRVSAAVAGLAAWFVRQFKANITAGFNPGGGHKSPGHNVTGTAIDIVPGPGGNWGLIGDAVAAAVRRGLTVYYDGSRGSTRLADHGPGNHAHIELGSGGGAAALPAPELARVLVEGADSPLKLTIQTGLGRVREAAQLRFEELLGSGVEGAEGASGGGFSKAALKQLWTRAGGNPNAANLAAAIALAESGGNPDATSHNPVSGGRNLGLWQIDSGSHPDATLDPLGNARAAVRISSNGRNWGAWETFVRGRHVQFLQRGGLLEMLQRGGLPRQLDTTIRKLRTGKRSKNRRRALQGLLGKLDALDIPKKLTSELKGLERDQQVFGEFASRASQLTIEPDDGEPILGRVGGHTEAEWLSKQLEALFAWRNRLIQAEAIVVEKREETTRLIEQAKKRLRAFTLAWRKGAALKKRLERSLETVMERLEKARGASKPDRERIRSLRERAMGLQGRIRRVDRQQTARERVRDALKDRIIPALDEKRTSLNDARGDLLQNLESVQGLGAPMEFLQALPQVGVLGGQIFDVQMRLRDIAERPPRVTDTQGSETAASDPAAEERARLFEELLREQTQRTRVSEEQFKVLRDFPRFGGVFHEGGIVPGPPDQERTAILRGGEGVFTTDQMEALGQPSQIVIVVEDGAVDTHKIRAIADERVEVVTRRQARGAARALPGRGGGLLG